MAFVCSSYGLHYIKFGLQPRLKIVLEIQLFETKRTLHVWDAPRLVPFLNERSFPVALDSDRDDLAANPVTKKRAWGEIGLLGVF